MKIPPRLVDSSSVGKVCKLKKALYGLKQSRRAWFEQFFRAMKRFGQTGAITELKLFNSSLEEVKGGGNTEEVILVGKQVGSFFRESSGGKREIGSTSKGVVGEEEGVLYQYSLDLQEYLPKDLLLQYEEDDRRGDLEGCDPLLLTPLAVVSKMAIILGCHLGGCWKEFKDFIEWWGYLVKVVRINYWHYLRRLKLPEINQWKNIRILIRLHQGQKVNGN
jgi:hypothetical protein